MHAEVDFIAGSLHAGPPKASGAGALQVGQKRSAGQIAKALGCAKSTVLAVLNAEGVARRSRRQHAVGTADNIDRYHVGQLPYGKKVVDGQIVDHVGEQRVIGTMRRRRAAGASFESIAAELDANDVKTKRHRKWHHHAVARILRRSFGPT